MARRQREAKLIYDPDAESKTNTDTDTETEEPEQYMPPVPGSEKANYNMQELYSMMMSDMQTSRHQPQIDNTYNELSQRGQLWTQDIWNRIKESSQNLFSEISNI